MKCSNCGKDIANDSIFCEYCGAKVKQNESHLSLKRLRRKWLWASILAIPLLVVMFMYFYVDNPKLHRFDIKINTDYFWDGGKYIWFDVSPTFPSSKCPYHLMHKWTGISVDLDGILISSLKGNFQSKDIDNQSSRWYFIIPKEEMPFEPGHTYKIRIYGEHYGLWFNREARPIDFVLKIPKEVDLEVSDGLARQVWLTNN